MDKRNNGFAVKTHFEGKDPIVRQIYDHLLKHSRRFGPVIEDPKKTSIHLNHATAFAGVATRKNAIILTIKSDQDLDSPRIHKSEQTSARRLHHEVKLTTTAAAHAQLIRPL